MLYRSAEPTVYSYEDIQAIYIKQLCYTLSMDNETTAQ